MSDTLTMEAFGLEEFQRAMTEAPRESYRFVKQEHRRFAARTRRQFIGERMSGRPGMNWGGHGKKHAKSVGGNVRMDQKDEGTLDSMRVWGKLSRFLSRHETGTTITGNLAIPIGDTPRIGKQKGQAIQTLYGQRPFRIPNTDLLAVTVGGQLKPVYKLVHAVTLPARLGFRTFMRGRIADFKARTLQATLRGFKVALDRNTKQLARAVSSAVGI